MMTRRASFVRIKLICNILFVHIRVMENDSITEKIIGVCFDVQNELGTGFVEKVYENALRVALESEGFKLDQQIAVKVHFREVIVGEFVADLIVDNSIVIELKAVKQLLPEHQAQLINYLKATKIERGLLVNFASSRLEVKRGEFRNT